MQVSALSNHCIQTASHMYVIDSSVVYIHIVLCSSKCSLSCSPGRPNTCFWCTATHCLCCYWCCCWCCYGSPLTCRMLYPSLNQPLKLSVPLETSQESWWLRLCHLITSLQHFRLACMAHGCWRSWDAERGEGWGWQGRGYFIHREAAVHRS